MSCETIRAYGRSIVPKQRTLTERQESQARKVGHKYTTHVCWSIPQVYDRMEQIAIKEDIAGLIYLKENYWDFTKKNGVITIINGSKDILVALPKHPTWIEIAHACEKAVVASTDRHHVFIEDIKLIELNGKKYLTMVNGS